MKENRNAKHKDAYLAKEIAVRAGELMECYQWNENEVDKTAAIQALDAILKTANELQYRLMTVCVKDD